MLALPVLGAVYLSAILRRSVFARAGILTLGVALVVSGLIVGLPAKPVGARNPTTFAPLSPNNFSVQVENSLDLTAPIQVEFTRPMDEVNVASNVVVEPKVQLSLNWDANGKKLEITGSPQWAPQTYYSVDIPGSVLARDGVALGQPIHVVFVTGAATEGAITPTLTSGDRVAINTSFQLTFDRPVPLASVAEHWRITPAVAGSLTGDDPTDQRSQVFTFTPSSPLTPNTQYAVSLEAGAVDQRGATIMTVQPLMVRTVEAPGVVRFRPVDQASDIDPGQEVSVRFTMAMDTAATTSAFTVTANGKAVTGATRWAEDDTVLVLTPDSKFDWSADVVMTVSTAAKSADGVPMTASASAAFKVAAKPEPPKPPAAVGGGGGGGGTPITPPSIGPVGSAPWYGWEVYSLQLLNCTRTGGWVSGAGSCSAGANRWGSAGALALDPGISANVARPYAKYMADRNILDHFAYGTPGTRLAAAGYTSYKWAENIAWPVASDSGMVAVATFFQNEAPCSSCHFANIMNATYDRVGIGVWVERGRAWVVFDFYHP